MDHFSLSLSSLEPRQLTLPQNMHSHHLIHSLPSSACWVHVDLAPFSDPIHPLHSPIRILLFIYYTPPLLVNIFTPCPLLPTWHEWSQRIIGPEFASSWQGDGSLQQGERDSASGSTFNGHEAHKAGDRFWTHLRESNGGPEEYQREPWKVNTPAPPYSGPPSLSFLYAFICFQDQ